MGNKKLTTALVLFAKDEGKSIGPLIDEAYSYINKGDIFVVDGHSVDNTAFIAREKGASLFLDEKKGKGNAIQLAINSIERDVLIFMDSDGSHRPQEIPLLLEPFLVDESVDMVIGSRFKGGSEELSGSLQEKVRFAGNVLGTFIVNLIWKAKLTDIQNGFRAIKRATMRELSLTENSFAIEQEMVMKCLKNKKKIIEVPSLELRRKYNNSHIAPFEMLPKYIWSFIKNIF